MLAEPVAERGESLFAAHADAIERVLAYVCRRNRLSPEDADEFGGIVRLRMVEDDYAVLRAFEGRSSAQTYLTVVIQRLFLDFRTHQWGKWRPSAEARRLGPTAVLYERLTTRDGLTPGEAVQAMRSNHRVAESESELEAVVRRLPARVRRRIVGEDDIADVAGSAHDGEAAVLAGEAESAQARSYAALASAVAGLPPQDRLIVQYRFEHGLQIAEIARLMRLEAKPLYRRIEGILRGLRRSLEAAGLDAAGVRGLFADSEGPVRPGWGAGRNREERPSL